MREEIDRVEFCLADESWVPRMAEGWRAGERKNFHLNDGFSVVAHQSGQLIGYISVVWRQLPNPLKNIQEAFIDFIET